MRRGIVALGLVGAMAGCGQDDSQREVARRSVSGPETSLRGAAATPANTSPDLSCIGPAVDGAADYAIWAFKGSDAHYARVVVLEAAKASAKSFETVADYDQYRDVSPPPPTDVVFRYIFGTTSPAAGDYSVMLTEGGFTHGVTVEVKKITTTGPVVVASLTCSRV